jgi:hypothetical protein
MTAHRFGQLAVAAALALAALPQMVDAQKVPVEIDKCEVLEYLPVHHHPYWYPFGPRIVVGTPVTDGIEIKYVNRAPLTADRVVFLVNYRGEVERVVDVGKFSPGAPIDHTFGQFSGLVYLGPTPNVCRVLAMRFVDGTFIRAAP